MASKPLLDHRAMEVAASARKVLTFMAAKRVPLTPSNYKRCYEKLVGPEDLDTAEPTRTADSDAMVQQFKSAVAMFLEHLRNTGEHAAGDHVPLIELENAFNAASDAKQIEALKGKLRTVMQGADSRNRAAQGQRENAFRNVIDSLVESFKDQVDGGGAITEELQDHTARLEQLVESHPDIPEIQGLKAVADGVRGSMGKFQDQREQASSLLAESQAEISRLKAEILKREEEATIDELTNIHNRRAFNQKMEEEHVRFERYNTPFSLVMMDIDHFKHFNDTYGHPTGDKVLRTLSDVVKQIMRKTDFFARYGGEEFVIIAGGTNLENTALFAEKVRKKVEEINFLYENESITVTVSLGVAEAAPGDTIDTLIKRADDCLYSAKQAGRNRVCSSLEE